jgi:hypothetical protein
MGGAAGIVWQVRQAWLSEARGFCGRLGWWQVAQATPSLPAWFSWSKVTAPSFAGSVTLPLGRCAAGEAGAAGGPAAGFSACVAGGGPEVAAAGVEEAWGCVAGVVTGGFDGAAACGGVVVAGAAGDVAAAGAPGAGTTGMGDAGWAVTGGGSCSFPQAKAIGARRRTVASRRTT